jgi:hypothetical protein
MSTDRDSKRATTGVFAKDGTGDQEIGGGGGGRLLRHSTMTTATTTIRATIPSVFMILAFYRS